MDVSLICDTLTVTTSKTICLSNLILDRHVTAGFSPFDAVAPPPTKRTSHKTRTLLRKKRRTKRKLFNGDESNDGELYGSFFGSDGGDGYGPFGGGNGGGGGSGWDFGGQNWHEDESSSSSSSWSVNAMDLFYEVICWIALSNCVHFAFKKAVRIATNGILEAEGAGEREKVSMAMPLVSVC